MSEEEAFNKLLLLSPDYAFSIRRCVWQHVFSPGDSKRAIEYHVFTFGPDGECRLFIAGLLREAVEKAEKSYREQREKASAA